MHFRRPISKIILLLLLLSLLLLSLLLLLSIKFFQSEKSVIRIGQRRQLLFLLQLVTRPPLAMRKVNKEVRERKRKRVVVVSVYNVARL